MKDHMRKHTSKNKHSIYRKTSKRVMKSLDGIFESSRSKMDETVHRLVDFLEGDFRTVILSSKMLEVSEVAEVARDPIRERIRVILYEIESQFEEIPYTEQMDLDDVHLPQPVPQAVSVDAVVPSAPHAAASEGMALDS